MTSSIDLDGDIPRTGDTASGSGGAELSGDREDGAEDPGPRAGAPGLQAFVAYLWRLSLGDEVGHVPFRPAPSDR